MTVLLTKSSVKIDKSQNDDWLNAVMYLEPTYSTKVCKGRSQGCFKSCLIHSGRMPMASAVNARTNRTALYFEQNELFVMQLKGEIAGMLATATKQGKKLAIRLNGTSDLDFSEVYNSFKMVQFYEYTKRVDLAKKLGKLDNVDITFSKHENHSIESVKYLTDKQINVAVVFDTSKENIPTEYNGVTVINGDKHDRRFEDTKGRIVGLSLKGTNKVKQIARATGFAVAV
tara:strand:- start:35 stop:721 length:687 start_codon:yes stop_codon:yes gene_type:complete